MEMIASFTGPFRWLSNFHTSETFFGRQKYLCVEGAFQAAKCLDPAVRKKFELLSGRDAKREGGKVELRPGWNDIRDTVMYECLMSKFMSDETLFRLLVETDAAILVEGNDWHDNYWGDCTCQRCKNIIGQNKLGKILMHLRTEFQIMIGQEIAKEQENSDDLP